MAKGPHKPGSGATEKRLVWEDPHPEHQEIHDALREFRDLFRQTRWQHTSLTWSPLTYPRHLVYEHLRVRNISSLCTADFSVRTVRRLELLAELDHPPHFLRKVEPWERELLLLATTAVAVFRDELDDIPLEDYWAEDNVDPSFPFSLYYNMYPGSRSSLALPVKRKWGQHPQLWCRSFPMAHVLFRSKKARAFIPPGHLNRLAKQYAMAMDTSAAFHSWCTIFRIIDEFYPPLEEAPNHPHAFYYDAMLAQLWQCAQSEVELNIDYSLATWLREACQQPQPIYEEKMQCMRDGGIPEDLPHPIRALAHHVHADHPVLHELAAYLAELGAIGWLPADGVTCSLKRVRDYTGTRRVYGEYSGSPRVRKPTSERTSRLQRAITHVLKFTETTDEVSVDREALLGRFGNEELKRLYSDRGAFTTSEGAVEYFILWYAKHLASHPVVAAHPSLSIYLAHLTTDQWFDYTQYRSRHREMLSDVYEVLRREYLSPEKNNGAALRAVLIGTYDLKAFSSNKVPEEHRTGVGPLTTERIDAIVSQVNEYDSQMAAQRAEQEAAQQQVRAWQEVQAHLEAARKRMEAAEESAKRKREAASKPKTSTTDDEGLPRYRL